MLPPLIPLIPRKNHHTIRGDDDGRRRRQPMPAFAACNDATPIACRPRIDPVLVYIAVEDFEP